MHGGKKPKVRCLFNINSWLQGIDRIVGAQAPSFGTAHTQLCTILVCFVNTTIVSVVEGSRWSSVRRYWTQVYLFNTCTSIEQQGWMDDACRSLVEGVNYQPGNCRPNIDQLSFLVVFHLMHFYYYKSRRLKLRTYNEAAKWATNLFGVSLYLVGSGCICCTTFAGFPIKHILLQRNLRRKRRGRKKEIVPVVSFSPIPALSQRQPNSPPPLGLSTHNWKKCGPASSHTDPTVY